MPLRLASYDSGLCDLVATPSHVYWLEIRSRAHAPRDSGRGGSGVPGAVLQCDDAGGAFTRTSRRSGEKVTLAELDYRPSGLTARGDTFYWTGAPCSGAGRRHDDPEWLWSYRDGDSSGPIAIGDRDRNYLGVVVSRKSVFVSDRFGKGGALRVDAAHPDGEEMLPYSEQPWLIAADDRALVWTDRSWLVSRTDVVTRETAKGGARLGAMPMDGAAFAGGWLVRTTEAIVVVSRDGTKELARVVIPSYGDRGNGAFAAGRYYYWADGDDTLSRFDVTTHAVARVHAPEAKQACGVAVEGDTIFWADRARSAVFVWRTSAFDDSAR